MRPRQRLRRFASAYRRASSLRKLASETLGIAVEGKRRPHRADQPIRSLAELLKEIEPLKVGEMTRVLRTARGYQIIKLETVTPIKVKTLDEARAEIADKIAAQKQRGQMREYLQQLRAQAIIDWKNEEVKKAFEVGVKQQAEGAPTQ